MLLLINDFLHDSHHHYYISVSVLIIISMQLLTSLLWSPVSFVSLVSFSRLSASIVTSDSSLSSWVILKSCNESSTFLHFSDDWMSSDFFTSNLKFFSLSFVWTRPTVSITELFKLVSSSSFSFSFSSFYFLFLSQWAGSNWLRLFLCGTDILPKVKKLVINKFNSKAKEMEP